MLKSELKSTTRNRATKTKGTTMAMVENIKTTRTRIVTSDQKYLIDVLSKSAADLDVPSPPMESSLNRLLLLLRWLAYGLYFRLRYIQASNVNDWIAWSLLTLEIFGAFPVILSQFYICLGLLVKRPPRESCELIGNHVPRVSILITCCGEDSQLLMDCVRAAASQDYPPDQYQIFVLDDAANPQIRKLIQIYGDQQSDGPKVTYLARKKIPGAPHYYKSGNLRFGFEESAKLFDSPFVGGLDVDAVMDRLWLRRALPHLLVDGGVDLINVRNRNYNVPPRDVLYSATQFLQNANLTVEDQLGTVGCYGCGYIVRRSCVEEIGGWPLVNVGEDMLLSFMLCAIGKRIGASPEILQTDLCPESIDAMLAQRGRWLDGDLNSCRRFRCFIPGLDPGKQRTLVQAASGMLGSLRLHSCVTDFFMLALLPLVIPLTVLKGAMALDTTTTFLTIQRAYLFSILMNKISTRIISGSLSGESTLFSAGDLSGQGEVGFWIVCYQFKRLLLFYTSSIKVSFKATGTIKAKYSASSSFVSRLLSSYCLPFLCYSIVTAYMLVSCIYQLKSREAAVLAAANITAFGSSIHSVSNRYYCTAGLVWLFELSVNMSSPWRYMLWPPKMPDRSTLLKRSLESNPLGNTNQTSDEKEKPTSKDSCGDDKGIPSLLYDKMLDFPWLDVLQLGIVFLIDWSPGWIGW